MIESRVVAQTADGPMSARIWRPDGGGSFPVVLCYHAGPGLGAHIYSVARRFAEEGYYAAVPDLYHREGPEITFDMPALMEPDSDELRRLLRIVGETTPDLMVADSVALLDAIRQDTAAEPGPVGSIGFCHTTRTVIRAMSAHPDTFTAGAIMHPAYAVTDAPDSPHLLVKNIVGDIYGGFGAVDEVAPLSEQQPLITELEKLGHRATVEIHAHGGHGFLWSGTPAYDPQGAVSAWQNTLRIFDHRLKAQSLA
ncbi:dienelactone hydrolase family protein [Streptomyces sp. NPDC048002]|uniref:dienelactone hydrolase family protein n=1 Tax=Streptomyces sp. NPDC048002 TaxID=3154344 RepID=UPI0033EA734B